MFTQWKYMHLNTFTSFEKQLELKFSQKQRWLELDILHKFHKYIFSSVGKKLSSPQYVFLIRSQGDANQGLRLWVLLVYHYFFSSGLQFFGPCCSNLLISSTVCNVQKNGWHLSRSALAAVLASRLYVLFFMADTFPGQEPYVATYHQVQRTQRLYCKCAEKSSQVKKKGFYLIQYLLDMKFWIQPSAKQLFTVVSVQKALDRRGKETRRIGVQNLPDEFNNFKCSSPKPSIIYFGLP